MNIILTVQTTHCLRITQSLYVEQGQIFANDLIQLYHVYHTTRDRIKEDHILNNHISTSNTFHMKRCIVRDKITYDFHRKGISDP